VAAPVIPLLLGAAAMALILDSGTTRLPPIGSGARSSAPPPEKIVVSPSAAGKSVHHRRAATPTHSGQTSATGGSGAGASRPSTGGTSIAQAPSAAAGTNVAQTQRNGNSAPPKAQPPAAP
jgi:hypothetical protein